jgi:arginine repressor
VKERLNNEDSKMNQRTQRLSIIRKIIRTEYISSQEELIARLEESGVTVTQSTLSRDLKFMNVAKVPHKEKGYIYVLPNAAHSDILVSTNLTDNIIDVYRAADIFVFPSEYEGFGLALAEAMSVGLAVVGCHDCTAVSELLSEDCGELVAPDGQSMAEGLTKLIESPEQRTYYGKKAHERAKEFSPDLIWSQWESLIKKVI